MSSELACEVFKSNKNGTKVFLNGHAYNKVNSKNNVYYWMCEMRKNEIYQCKVMLKTTVNGKGVHIPSKPTQNHTHGPDPLRKNIADLRQKLKKEVAGGSKLCKILNECKSDVPSEVLESLPSTSAIKQCMYREKCKIRSKIEEPDNLEFEINESMTQIECKNFIIKDRKYDKKRIIILSTFKLMDILSRSDYWILDGTFKSVTTILTQLYTIHGNIFQDDPKTFPLIFFLCSHKDKRTYDAIFEMIMEYEAENNIDIKPKVCICGFSEKTDGAVIMFTSALCIFAIKNIKTNNS